MSSKRTAYEPILMVGVNTQYDCETEFADTRTHIQDEDKHREINDSGIATTDLWSADKITTELAGKISTGSISNDDIPDDEIAPSKLDALSLPGSGQDGYVPTYNHTAGQFEWEDMSGVVGQDTYMVKWDAVDTAEHLGQKIPAPDTATGGHVLWTNGTDYALDLILSGCDSGNIDQIVKVNGSGDGYDFYGFGLPAPESGTLGKCIYVQEEGPVTESYGLATMIKVIEDDLDLYISATGSDESGTGESGTPWHSLNKAFNYLADKWINDSITVTIHVAGIYSIPAPDTLIVDHPCTNRIVIDGSGKAATVYYFNTDRETMIVKRPGLTITDMSFKGLGQGAFGGIALRVYNGSVDLNNVRFYNFELGLSAHEGGVLCLNNTCEVDACVSYCLSAAAGGTIFADYVYLDGETKSSTTGHAARCYGGKLYLNAATISNFSGGIYSAQGGMVIADGVVFSNVDSLYSPAATTSESGTPTFGNIGAWIFNSYA